MIPKNAQLCVVFLGTLIATHSLIYKKKTYTPVPKLASRPLKLGRAPKRTFRFPNPPFSGVNSLFSFGFHRNQNSVTLGFSARQKSNFFGELLPSGQPGLEAHKDELKRFKGNLEEQKKTSKRSTQHHSTYMVMYGIFSYIYPLKLLTCWQTSVCLRVFFS